MGSVLFGIYLLHSPSSTSTQMKKRDGFCRAEGPGMDQTPPISSSPNGRDIIAQGNALEATVRKGSEP